MAETYKPFGAALTTTYATVYTCPSATTAIVLSAIAANVDGSVSAGVSAQWLDSSNSDTAKRIIDGVVVPATASVNLMSGPIALEAGDAFQAKASASGDIELTLVVDEIT